MTALRDDTFARRPVGARRRRSQGVTAFVLGMLCVALLVLSRIDNPVISHVRHTLVDLVSPLLARVATALAPVRSLRERLSAMSVPAEELDRLRAENQRLAGWEARAKELERRLVDLQGLARAVQDQAISYVTGRVVADAGGPFARSVLLSVGRDHGLRSGYPVISADGLVGRVLETGPRAARVLLLTDLNSRIPVLVGEGDIKGVMMGDNGTAPRLAHIPATALIKTGDAVVTSGVGGLFPRGLRIGTVIDTPSGLTVALHARLDQIDHVSILFHQSPALDLVRDEAKPPNTGRRSLAGQPIPPEPSPSQPNR
ncbi:MAG: rod shape-determining protein MreC [Hyphomicrobiaceae bacterium]